MLYSPGKQQILNLLSFSRILAALVKLKILELRYCLAYPDLKSGWSQFEKKRNKRAKKQTCYKKQVKNNIDNYEV